jgi:hypothetical protein
MTHNTGIEFSSIIPGFIKEFEIVDVIKEIAPRDFLIVCSDDDKYSKDAPQIYELAKERYIEKNSEDRLQIIQYTGGHQITQERFYYMIKWIVNHAK